MEKVLEKFENKLDIRKTVKILFAIFMIAQPILDIYMSLCDSKIQILGVSLATILRFVWVFVMTILTMIYARKNKSTKLLIGYGVLVVIYAIFHHLNAVGFSVPLAEGKYNALSEILYLARMCIPIALIYIIFNIKLSYKEIKKIVISASLIISISILITNIFKVSFIAYSEDQDYISGNIVEWFTKGIGNEDKSEWVRYTARGWFQSANQLSGLMVILVPILTYVALKENKIRYWIVTLLHIIAMIGLTTRVGAVGGILAMLAVIFVNILEKIIHKEISLKVFKEKNLYCIIFSLAILGIFFYFSPFKIRASTDNLGYDILSNKPPVDNTNVKDVEPDTQAKIDYILENAEKENIYGYFLYQAYPYTEDVDFWYNLLVNVPEYERAGNRKLKAILIDRILERDNRASNYIWGISFTTSSSFVWPERDFETQIPSLGITGFALFIGPYIAILLFGIGKFFVQFKENLYLSKVIYMISLCMGYVAAYSSGHVLNEIFPFTFLAMVAGIVLNMCFDSDPEELEDTN